MLSRVADACTGSAAIWNGPSTPRASSTSTSTLARSIAEPTPAAGSLRLERCADRRSDSRSTALLIDDSIFEPQESVDRRCIATARENARQVREEISSDMWEQLNSLFLRQAGAERDVWPRARTTCMRLGIEGVHLFQGITDSTMGHGEGWQYLQVGRFVERASSTAASSNSTSATVPSAPRTGRPKDRTGMGRSAALVLRARSLLQALYRGHPPRAHRRISPAQPGVPALRPVCRGASRGGDPHHRAGHDRARGGRAERVAGRLHAHARLRYRSTRS